MSHISNLSLTWAAGDEQDVYLRWATPTRQDVARVSGATVTGVKVWLEQTDGKPGYRLKLEADLPELPATISPPVFP